MSRAFVSQPLLCASSSTFGAGTLGGSPLFEHSLNYAQVSVGIYALAQAQVERLSNLSENWDGYGAFPIVRPTIDSALRILNEFDSFPSLNVPVITPHPNGLITFEWESNFGEAYLEIGRTSCCFFAKPNLGKLVEWGDLTELLPVDAIKHAIKELLFPSPDASHSVSSAMIRHAAAA